MAKRGTKSKAVTKDSGHSTGHQHATTQYGICFKIAAMFITLQAMSEPCVQPSRQLIALKQRAAALQLRQPQYEELHKGGRDASAPGTRASRPLNIPQCKITRHYVFFPDDFLADDFFEVFGGLVAAALERTAFLVGLEVGDFLSVVFADARFCFATAFSVSEA